MININPTGLIMKSTEVHILQSKHVKQQRENTTPRTYKVTE